MLDRKKLNKIFSNTATLLEIKGELPFKTKAYSNAAELLANEEIDFDNLIKENNLKSVSGIGDAISKKILEFAETGKIEFFDKLTSEFPVELVEISKLAKIGVKKTAQIFKELGISDIKSLEKACEENKIAILKGFGEKTQENILTSISHTKASKGRFLQNKLVDDTKNIIDLLRKNNIFIAVEVIGEQARVAEIIDNVSVLASVDDLSEFSPEKVQNLKIVELEKNDLFFKFELNFDENYKSFLIVTNQENYVYLKHKFTSSIEYYNSFENYIKIKQIDINFKSLKSEKEIYSQSNLPYIYPELRESELAIEKAQKNEIPKLIENSDMKGLLHFHTIWSDGKNSIKEMALTAKDLGFEYAGVTDHSKSAFYANGLTEERIIKQHKEIDELNSENLGIHIFKGIESDILLDGSLDYDDEVLASFDFVIASIHSSFTMSKEDMTNRICKALKNPYTMMLGHPTGRLLLSRAGYEVDIDKIIDTAAEYNKIIELNANPYRLDLSWQNIIKAKEKGVKISINPDSHKTTTLSDIFIGCGIARKGWIETKDVLNTLNLQEFSQFIDEFKKGIKK